MLFSLLIIGLLTGIFVQITLARPTRKTAKYNQSVYLGRRLILSLILVILILVAVALGWITPNPNPYKI
jgi:hypothetical protein